MFKVREVINSLPTLDGHWWIENNGVINDKYFPEYKNISKFYTVRALKKEEWVYLPADDLTQKVLKAMVNKVILSVYDTVELFIKDYIKIVGKEPMPMFCVTNALMEQYLNGGVVVCGSYGFKKVNNMWWEFGGEGWKTKQFIKKTK